MVEIPIFIKKQIEETEKGKKIIKKIPIKKKYSEDEIFSLAFKNLQFLNEIAMTEPVSSFLEKNDRIIEVLGNFSTRWDPTQAMVSLGMLCLAKKKRKIGLFFWLDAGYPADRSDNEYTLITQKELKNYWHKKSLEIFARLTEQEIWRNIEKWLKIMRS